MKKKNKLIWIAIISVITVISIIVGIFLIKDKNNLTIVERKWIDNNVNSVLNINIVNNANVFGINGDGVFYDFLKDFADNYKLKINPITYDYEINKTGLSFEVKKEVTKDDVVFYKDHYVLIGLKNEVINNYEDFNGKTIGVITNDLSYISKNITGTLVTFTQYNNNNDLITALGDTINYAIVPLNLYLNIILSNNYEILYHLSDVNYFYTLKTDNELLSNIIQKYYNKVWYQHFNQSYKKNKFNLFVNSLNITETEVDAIRSGVYNYAFVNSSPYDVIKGGTYGGINAVVLKEFSDFSEVEFNFVKYKNYKDFVKAIDKNKVDLYFNKYNLNNSFYETNSGFNLKFDIIAHQNNPIVIKSINSLENKTVYVEENSRLYDYVSKIKNIKVKTYSNEKELFKLNKKDVIIIIDTNNFNYYNTNQLKNYTTRLTDVANTKLNFKVDNNSALYKLLNKYISVLDDDEIIYKGINNHHVTMKTGNVMGTIAKYIIYFVILAVIITFVLIKKTRKIQIARKIKKEDKMKFIDQLTSLKNRNYLNECLENWNNNTIYPQAIIVVDLNGIQKLNDQFGYNEGDRQIKAFANALIKTQPDNSEIMRTDGNEFTIYLIGYSQKQVTNYIHKLNKEVIKLPYEKGAEFGYSMINDNLKTIEDSLNEALIDMRKQKVEINNESRN